VHILFIMNWVECDCIGNLSLWMPIRRHFNYRF
jgi:hypothetical protein